MIVLLYSNRLFRIGGCKVAETRELSTKEAADYLGMTRQALTNAADRGEVGRKVEAIGRNPPYVYRFTKAELDVWAAREKNKGGRPKSADLILTPRIGAAI